MPLPRSRTDQLQTALFGMVMHFSNGVELQRHIACPFAGYLERLWLVASAPTGGAGASVAIRLNDQATGISIAVGGAQGAYVPTLLEWNAMDSPIVFNTGDVLGLVPTLPGVGTSNIVAQIALGRT